ncbi:hypothetical protein GCM10009609_36260 [Pseudonocardia aurantiaca]
MTQLASALANRLLPGRMRTEVRGAVVALPRGIGKADRPHVVHGVVTDRQTDVGPVTACSQDSNEDAQAAAVHWLESRPGRECTLLDHGTATLAGRLRPPMTTVRTTRVTTVFV